MTGEKRRRSRRKTERERIWSIVTCDPVSLRTRECPLFGRTLPCSSSIPCGNMYSESSPPVLSQVVNLAGPRHWNVNHWTFFNGLNKDRTKESTSYPVTKNRRDGIWTRLIVRRVLGAIPSRNVGHYMTRVTDVMTFRRLCRSTFREFSPYYPLLTRGSVCREWKRGLPLLIPRIESNKSQPFHKEKDGV